MSASEVREILLRSNLDLLEDPSYYNPTLNLNQYDNIYELRTVVDQLSGIEGLADLVAVVKDSIVYSSLVSVGGFVAANVAEAEDIDRYLHELYAKATALLSFLNSILPEEKEDSIRIKLPPVRDFDELGKVINDLKLAISVPIADSFWNTDGQVIIESVESGSILIWVSLMSKRAMRLVAEICWAGAVIANKIQEARFVSKKVAEYGMNIDYQNNLKDAQQKLLDTLTETEASVIRKKMNGEDVTVDNEAIERLKNSITLIGELYVKGAEVRPSLTTREEVANLFPKSGLQYLIESRTKRLAEGSVAEGDSEQAK